VALSAIVSYPTRRAPELAKRAERAAPSGTWRVLRAPADAGTPITRPEHGVQSVMPQPLVEVFFEGSKYNSVSRAQSGTWLP